MGLRRTLTVGAALLGALVIVVMGAPWGGAPEAPRAQSERSPDSPEVDERGPGLTAVRARELEQGINARDPERLREVLLLGDEHDPVEVAEQALPASSRLTIDEQTFTRLDDAGAVVDGRVVGEQEYAVQLLLMQVEGRWLLAGSAEPELVS